ncbi:MAG: tyrosine--tRNA ligase [Deltaproteobacteria bacterium]|nr:tyrosine--tRNA ligase [Deltaproteobacteria bacterium]
MTSPILDILEQRSLMQDCSNRAELAALFASEPVTAYCGFDPTADSLHVGHLLPVVVLRWLQHCGHRPIVVLGSVTGMIGDPSGKSEERKLLDESLIAQYKRGLSAQLGKLLPSTANNPVQVVENGEWLSKLSMVEYLRDVGKHVTVNAMLAKDSVRTRLENREQGISYTEFSYMLLQSYDFYHLYTAKGCRLQLGGSDQWGNITLGIDLIRRKSPEGSPPAYGLSIPLLLSSAGTKFGKTEAGAVWLDPQRTSPYKFYQYFLNTRDDDVVRLLKVFTMLPLEQIAALEANLVAKPEERGAQRALAREVTTWIHSATEAEKAERASSVLFGGDVTGLDRGTLLEIFGDVPSVDLPKSEALPNLVELLVKAGATDSKGGAKRLIEGGGVYLNNIRATGAQQTVEEKDFLDGSLLILRSGKKNYFLVNRA